MDLIYGLMVFSIGIGTGVLSGAFGIGGATLTTVAIRDLLGRSGEIALGTPLPIVIPTAISGTIVYKMKKMIKMKIAIVSGIAGSVAAFLAALSTGYFAGEILMLITAVYIAIVGVRFSWNVENNKRKPNESLKLAALIGIVAGAVSGFLGVGGGIVQIPLYTFVMGFCLHDAIGTSLMTMAIYAIPGSIGHFMLGHVDFGLLLPIGLGTILGAQVGARFAVKAKDRKLRLAFTAYLFLIAFAMAAIEIVRILGV